LPNGDGAKVFEFIEEALDKIAFTIEREIAGPRRLAVGFRRDHRRDVSRGESIEERVGIVGLIANFSASSAALDRNRPTSAGQSSLQRSHIGSQDR
jgi:hypothetical protein